MHSHPPPSRAHQWWLVLLIAVLAGQACRSAPAQPPAVVTAPPAAPTAAAAKADSESIRWVRDSAEYEAATRQVYRAATARVEQDGAARPRGTWAVVLDADETAISNLVYQQERGREGVAFTPATWKLWVQRREATPVPGVAAFLSRVRGLGGRIAIVTNRLGSECPDTEAVFAKHQLAYDVILCRPDGAPSDKNPRFQSVAQGTTPLGGGPLEIVAFIGDNILDFPDLAQSVKQKGDQGFADFGVRYFLVPNPMYGSW